MGKLRSDSYVDGPARLSFRTNFLMGRRAGRLKIQELKITDQVAEHEIARPSNRWLHTNVEGCR